MAAVLERIATVVVLEFESLSEFELLEVESSEVESSEVELSEVESSDIESSVESSLMVAGWMAVRCLRRSGQVP